jgi:hypothetical protein
VLDPFTFVPAVTNSSVGIASLLYSIRRNRRSDVAARSVDARDHLEAHVAFEQAAVSVLYRLTYVSATGLPPSRLGILWTWPASYRATRDFPSAVEALHMTFSAAAIVGPAELLDASAAVFEAIGKGCGRFAMRRQPGKADFDASVEAAYEELGKYVSTLRDQLVPST